MSNDTQSTQDPGADGVFLADDILADLQRELEVKNGERTAELTTVIGGCTEKIEKVAVLKSKLEAFEPKFEENLPKQMEDLFLGMDGVFTELGIDRNLLDLLKKAVDYLKNQFERVEELCRDNPEMADVVKKRFFNNEGAKKQILERARLFKEKGLEVLAQASGILEGEKDILLVEKGQIDGLSRSLDRLKLPANPESLEVRKALFERRITEMLIRELGKVKDDFGPDLVKMAKKFTIGQENAPVRSEGSRRVVAAPDPRSHPEYQSYLEKVKYVEKVVIPMLAKEFVQKAEELELEKMPEGGSRDGVLAALFDRTDLDIDGLLWDNRYGGSVRRIVSIEKGANNMGRDSRGLYFEREENLVFLEELTKLQILIGAVFSGNVNARKKLWIQLENIFVLGGAKEKFAAEAERKGGEKRFTIDMAKEFYGTDASYYSDFIVNYSNFILMALTRSFKDDPKFFAQFQAMLNVGKDLPDDGFDLRGAKEARELVSIRKTLPRLSFRMNGGEVQYFDDGREETEVAYRRIADSLSRQAEQAALNGVKGPILTMEDARREVIRFEAEVVALKEQLRVGEVAKVAEIRKEAAGQVEAAVRDRDSLSDELEGLSRTLGSTSSAKGEVESRLGAVVQERGNLSAIVENLRRDLSKLDGDKNHLVTSLIQLKGDLSARVTQLVESKKLFGGGERKAQIDAFVEIIESIEGILTVLK